MTAFCFLLGGLLLLRKESKMGYGHYEELVCLMGYVYMSLN